MRERNQSVTLIGCGRMRACRRSRCDDTRERRTDRRAGVDLTSCGTRGRRTVELLCPDRCDAAPRRALCATVFLIKIRYLNTSSSTFGLRPVAHRRQSARETSVAAGAVDVCWGQGRPARFVATGEERHHHADDIHSSADDEGRHLRHRRPLARHRVLRSRRHARAARHVRRHDRTLKSGGGKIWLARRYQRTSGV